MRPCWDSRDSIAVLDRILFKGDRVIVPSNMRKKVLDTIHQSHLGIVRCKQLARDVVFWPGINNQIEELISKCSACQENRREQGHEPMICSEIPAYPWQVIAADLMKMEWK